MTIEAIAVDIDGTITDNTRKICISAIEALRKEDVILLDTRTVLEYERGHALGFINIPLDELRERVHELDYTKKVYVMCHSGFRSYVACKILNGYGIDTYNFAGGHMFYSSVHSDLGEK